MGQKGGFGIAAVVRLIGKGCYGVGVWDVWSGLPYVWMPPLLLARPMLPLSLL